MATAALVLVDQRFIIQTANVIISRALSRRVNPSRLT